MKDSSWGDIKLMSASRDLYLFLLLLLLCFSKCGLPRWLSGKELTCQCRRHRFGPWLRKIPSKRKWQPTPVSLPGKLHEQRSLAGFRPSSHKRVGHNLANRKQHRIISICRKLVNVSISSLFLVFVVIFP